MACPLCGEVCRCTPESRPRGAAVMQRRRFQPDLESYTPSGEILVDPEAPDWSEEQFLASLSEHQTKSSQTRFVLDGPAKEDERHTRSIASVPSPAVAVNDASVAPAVTVPINEKPSDVLDTSFVGDTGSSPDAQENRDAAAAELAAPGEISASATTAPPSESFWKDEVAERLNYYRARRKPRPPKYPSLHLKFDPVDWKEDARVLPDPTPNAPSGREALAFAPLPNGDVEKSKPTSGPSLSNSSVVSDTARIIEFPRSYYAPVLPPASTGDELADPVLEHPRIVEVPDRALPEPALGGIILEQEESEPERRPGFEIPLQSAPKKRRVMASVCDGSIVLSACALFAYIFFKITGSVPPLAAIGSMGCVLTVLFWSAYQYLLLTYSGTTFGLLTARLRLSQFDGSPVPRRLRRWRVIASLLSGMSLGLGYAWCFLDEDALCWHDRITHTYLAPLESVSPDYRG